MTANLLDRISDALSFAERHNLDPEMILALVIEAARKAKTEFLPAPFEESGADDLILLKAYWSRQPVGFHATVREIYDAVGVPFPSHGKALSYWLQAHARCIGTRGNINLYVKTGTIPHEAKGAPNGASFAKREGGAE